MKKTILAMLLLSACDVGSPVTGSTIGSRGVCSYYDVSHGVVCYFPCNITSQSGISCVKLDGGVVTLQPRSTP